MQIKTVCPLDCFAHCGLIATVEDNRITKIGGDPGHPLNHGLICSKGRRHLQRLYGPHRILTPMVKSGTGVWQPIWPGA